MKKTIANTPSGTPTLAPTIVGSLAGNGNFAVTVTVATGEMVTAGKVTVLARGVDIVVIVTAGNDTVVAGGVGAMDTVCQLTTPITVRTEGWPPNLMVRLPVAQSQLGSPSANIS
jgi:hypothetical protein